MGVGHADFLGMFVNDGPEPPKEWLDPFHIDETQAAVCAEEAERIEQATLMALAAAAIPRRLGWGTDGRELAADKKVSRKVAALYLDIWTNMYRNGKEAPKPPTWHVAQERAAKDEEARQTGAAVEWKPWVAERLVWLPQRRTQIARWALAGGCHLRWASRRADMISREIRGLDRTLLVYELRSVA